MVWHHVKTRMLTRHKDTFEIGMYILHQTLDAVQRGREQRSCPIRTHRVLCNRLCPNPSMNCTVHVPLESRVQSKHYQGRLCHANSLPRGCCDCARYGIWVQSNDATSIWSRMVQLAGHGSPGVLMATASDGPPCWLSIQMIAPNRRSLSHDI